MQPRNAGSRQTLRREAEARYRVLQSQTHIDGNRHERRRAAKVERFVWIVHREWRELLKELRTMRKDAVLT